MKKLLAVFLVICTLLVTSCSFFSQVTSEIDIPNIYINEIVSTNKSSYVDEVFGATDWVELYNHTDHDIDIGGWYLSDEKSPLEPFPGGVIIKSHDYVLILCAKSPKSDLNEKVFSGFALSKKGETLILYDSHGNSIEKIEVPELSTDISYGKNDKLENAFFLSPTPLAKNYGISAASLKELLTFGEDTDGLVVSEVMQNNKSFFKSADGKYYSWCEIFNGSSNSIDISAYCLTDTDANPLKWGFPSGTIIEPGQYLLVFFQGSVEGELHTAFNLSKNDRSLYIYSKTGKLISSLVWDTAIGANTSFGITADGATGYFSTPTPGEKNGETASATVALENMSDTDPVHINEILMSNGSSVIDSYGDRSSYIELYNSGNKTVDLGNYYLSDDENDPTKWTIGNVKIEPGQYLLIFASGKQSIDGEIHTPFRIGNTDKIITLTDIGNNRIDIVKLPENRFADVSIGRLPDSSELRLFILPTPGTANTTAHFSEIRGVKLP